MTEEATETEGPNLERTNMLWPPALKEAVRKKVGPRGVTEFTIGAVEQRLLNEDRVRDLEKEVGELRYLCQLLADRVAMGGDHEDRNHLLMEVELPSWMKTDGWPKDMKGLVPIAPPKVTKVYSEEELHKPAHVVAAETTPSKDRVYMTENGPIPIEPATATVEVIEQTEEAQEIFAQAGDDLFARIQSKAAEKGVDISGAGLVPASKIERPAGAHNHSFERRDDGNLYCTGCATWIDESTTPGTLHETDSEGEVTTEPVVELEVQTPVPTPVAAVPLPDAVTRNLDEIEVDF